MFLINFCTLLFVAHTVVVQGEYSFRHELDEIRELIKHMNAENRESLEILIAKQNEAKDLDSRVTILELEMDTVQAETVNLFDDIAELQNQDNFSDLRLRTVEQDVVYLNSNVSDLIATDALFEDRLANLESAVTEPWVSCESSPCRHGATCVDVNVGTFICMCRDGFFGRDCSNSYSQYSFLATFDTSLISPVPDILNFNLAKYNPGGHYDTTSGVYTVPLDGTYLITVSGRGEPDIDFGIQLYVDGVSTAESRNQGEPGYLNTLISIPLHLVTGQQVYVVPYELDVMLGTIDNGAFMYSWFSAHLVNAD